MRFIRIFLGVFIAFTVAFTALFGAKQIGVKPSAIKPTPYKGIITLWHIDSFEGGRGSRKQFLLDVASSFEKNNKGVLVMVIGHTKDSAEDSMENGLFPDVISFGGGVNVKNPVKCAFTRTFKGGTLNKDAFFTPWCRGGYALISNPKLADYKGEAIENLLVSQAEYTQPLVASLSQGLSVTNVEVMKPMDAYVKFTAGKTPYMLGTQRDVCRLINRGMDFKVTPLDAFNDLYQYVGITCNDAVKTAYAEKFVNYLLSDRIQEKLNEISMFSVFTDVKFEESALNTMQKQTQNKTLSAFVPAGELKNLQEVSLKAMAGDDGAKIKIKNVLI